MSDSSHTGHDGGQRPDLAPEGDRGQWEDVVDSEQPTADPAAPAPSHLAPGDPAPNHPTPGDPAPNHPTPGDPAPNHPTPGEPTAPSPAAPAQGLAAGEDKPVLVGVDGSEDARRALVYALRAARDRGRPLRVVHAVDDAVLAGAWGVVYDPTLLQQAGESVITEALDFIAQQGFPTERVSSEVVMGNPAGVLTRQSEDAGLLIVGRRSVRGLERLFVGSTSVGVAAAAHCPVVMVSAATNPEQTGGLRRIGVGVDAEANSEISLEAAFAEAERRGAHLDVIHAWTQPSGFFARQLSAEQAEKVVKATETMVRALVESVQRRHRGVAYDVHVLQAPPVDELVKRSAELDLLALGIQSTPFGGVGAVIRGVMAHSRCPLALVHTSR